VLRNYERSRLKRKVSLEQDTSELLEDSARFIGISADGSS